VYVAQGEKFTDWNFLFAELHILQAVKKNKLLLEVFGRCLPTPHQAKEFVTVKVKDALHKLVVVKL
jgi:hypothetical protein